MPEPQPSERELLKAVLPPLLEDFQYWFSRSRTLLEEDITFLSQGQQSDLLSRVKIAQQEVTTVQMLFQATNGQVGIETATLMPWHRLVTECWQVAMEWRSIESLAPGPEISQE